jgi:hypothetical protein
VLLAVRNDVLRRGQHAARALANFAIKDPPAAGGCRGNARFA